MLTQLGRPTSASGSAIAAGHHCEATSWQRKVPAMVGNGVRSRRWEKPAYAGAESKPSNSARARNACEHAIAFVVPPERLSKVGCHLSIAQNVPAAVMLLPASLQAQIAELQDSVSCRVPEVSRPIARSARSPSPISIPSQMNSTETL